MLVSKFMYPNNQDVARSRVMVQQQTLAGPHHADGEDSDHSNACDEDFDMPDAPDEAGKHLWCTCWYGLAAWR